MPTAKSMNDLLGSQFPFLSPNDLHDSGHVFYITGSRYDPNNVFEGRSSPRFVFNIRLVEELINANTGEMQREWALTLGETSVRMRVHEELQNNKDLEVGPLKLEPNEKNVWHFIDVEAKETKGKK